MEYTIEDFKKALELLKSDREDLNDYGKGRLEMAEGVENLILFGVGISKAEEYTKFIIMSDRKGLPLISLEDYIKHY